MRLCKQRDKYSCGPIALLNIDKLFGLRRTYKDLPRYQKKVKCDPDGTYTKEISRVLGRATRRSYKAAMEFLKQGPIMVQTKRIGHYYLLASVKDGITRVNYYRGQPCVVRISPQWLGWVLKNSYRTWYVTKAPRI
jgi:hypothetical protein